MSPYYDADGITIYHGDCRKIAPMLGRFDLLLTDPPYGIGRDGSKQTTSSHGGRKAYDFLGWDSERPESWLIQMLLDDEMARMGQRPAHLPERRRTGVD